MFLTINNYTDKTVTMIKNLDCIACVAGLEVGEKCGTPHIQAAVIWNSAKTFKQAQKLLCESGACYTKPMKGLWSQVATYCKKQGDVIRDDDYADGPGQGARVDIEALRDAVRAKRTNDELNDEHPEGCAKYARYINWTRAASNEANVVELPRGNKQLGLWLYGPSDTGKTTYVRDEYPGLYEKTHNRWWDGYENEEVVMIDDPPARWSSTLWDNVKTWVQEKPFRAQQCVGGEQRLIRFKTLVIVSNYAPWVYFQSDYDESIFRSRFQIHEVTAKLYNDFIGPVRVTTDEVAYGS